MSQSNIPVVALVGLPNSGKSSLLNRLGESKKAIVAKEAHTTRDLNYSECYWDGNYFKLIDTGGLVADPEGKIQKEVQVKSWAGIAQADLLIWVIDRKQRIESIADETISRIRKTNKPYMIVINKVDDPNQDTTVADYAHLGGKNFINISCNTGYGLGDLCDVIVARLQAMGYGQALRYNQSEIDTQKQKLPEERRLKKVERSLDGTYILRGADGIFESVNQYEDTLKNKRVENIVFDFYDVIFSAPTQKLIDALATKYDLNPEQAKIAFDLYEDRHYQKISTEEFTIAFTGLIGKKINFENDVHKLWSSFVEEIESTCDFLKYQKSVGKKIYYITNISSSYADRKLAGIYKYFDGGIASCEVGMQKPDLDIFRLLLQKYNLNAPNCFFIDDKFINIEAAKKLGFKAVVYKDGETDLYTELKIAEGKNPNPPKVLFLGKPNVGKSSLFNAMIGKEIQIVTDIPGTTLSVSDTLVERKLKYKKRILVKVPQEYK